MGKNKVTRSEAILQHCWQCMGYYSDGRNDCENLSCPLYTFMPYRDREPDLSIFEYSPRRVGMVRHDEIEKTSKEYTPEQKAAFVKRVQAGKKKNGKK